MTNVGKSDNANLKILFALVLILIVIVRILVVMKVTGVFALDFYSLAGLILAGAPFIMQQYKTRQKRDIIEEQFPNFLRDIASARNTGMTLPYAVKSVSTLDYSQLTPEIQKISDQISWGVPFDKTLTSFSARSKSKHIARTTSILIEADKAGGDITRILDDIAEYSKMIKEMEYEQRSSLSGYTMIIYFSYIVFLIIVVLLINFLIEGIGGAGDLVSAEKSQQYRSILFHMAIIQGTMTGLVAGKVGEGSIVYGFKHSAILVLLGYLTFRIIIQG